MKVAHVVIALAVIAAGVAVWKLTSGARANAAAEAWAVGRASGTIAPDGHRWDGTKWVRN